MKYIIKSIIKYHSDVFLLESDAGVLSWDV